MFKKELTIKADKAMGGLHFVDNKTDAPLVCAYKTLACVPYCAACREYKDGKVECARGNFIIGNLIDDDILEN